MLQFFRRFFQSKIGIVVTLVFLALIALAFASSDVSNTSVFGGVAGGDQVAQVGDRSIGAGDFSSTINSELERARAADPTLAMQGFVARGGVTDALEGMISRWAIAEFGEGFGLRAGKRLVDSEIASFPQFRGASGNFDQNVFRQALAQQGLSENAVRQDLAQGMLARQLMVAAGFGSRPPASIVRRYAQLLGERRLGKVAALPAAAYAPTGAPSEAQLQAYYTDNRADFIRPERRVLRYASFGDAALTNLPAPTPAQIAARYQRDIATYRAREQRGFTQLILPTEAAARAVLAEVNSGMKLENSARAKGLATAPIAPVDQAALAGTSSVAVAAAAFAADRGALAAPARGSLGWYVLRVDSVAADAGRTLAQASADIAAQLTTEQRRTALNEATARIEEELQEGRSLAEVAQELKLELRTTPPILATGQIYGTRTAIAETLGPILPLAFEMEEGEPQLAETVPGETFLIFDVSEITLSDTAPLRDIRPVVVEAWRRDAGMTAAAAAAERVQQRLRQRQTLAAALAAEEKNLPAVQSVSMDRRELAALGQVPQVLTLFFSMAEGSVKSMAMRESGSWFVVQLDDIQTSELAANDPILADTTAQLSSTATNEYAEQLVAAIRAGLDIEINDAAVDAMVAQLSGRGN